MSVDWKVDELVLPHLVDTEVPGDPEKPSPKGGVGPKFVRAPKDAEERFRCCVLSIGTVAEHPEGVAKNPLSVNLVQRSERGGVPLRESVEPPLFGQRILLRVTRHKQTTAHPDTMPASYVTANSPHRSRGR